MRPIVLGLTAFAVACNGQHYSPVGSYAYRSFGTTAVLTIGSNRTVSNVSYNAQVRDTTWGHWRMIDDTSFVIVNDSSDTRVIDSAKVQHTSKEQMGDTIPYSKFVRAGSDLIEINLFSDTIFTRNPPLRYYRVQ
jgi:hypothetical protein